MSGNAIITAVVILMLGIIGMLYYARVMEDRRIARAERVNRHTRVVNHIDKLVERLSRVPPTSSLYRILYSRQISSLEAIARDAPNNSLVKTTLPLVREKLSSVDEIDLANDVGMERPFSIPTNEAEANDLAKIIYSAQKFIEREEKIADATSMDVRKEKERLSVMMIQLKCELLYSKAVMSSSQNSLGNARLYLEKARDIMVDSGSQNPIVLALQEKVDALLKQTRAKLLNLQEERLKLPEEQIAADGLDRMMSGDKSHWV
tara:strand:+ start:1514 stop:2299 length:786 start_codon:yes stop_codon:yes gene_type:complete